MNEVILLRHLTMELLQSFYGTKTRVEFNGRCLKRDKATFNHGTIIIIYTVYETSRNFNISNYPAVENCLFGAVSLTKHADIDQYKYFWYRIVFDKHGFFSHPNGGTGKNVITFGVDMSSSTKIHNKNKDISILGQGPTQD